MAIYPHPDDETMGAGGLLLVAKSLGWKTIAVILTHGGAGQLHIHPRGRSIKQIRTAELEEAGKLREQEGEWYNWLKSLIAKYKPGLIVTYDHSGISGHPDHICVSLALKKVPAKLWWTTFPKGLKLGNKDVLYLRSDPTYILSLGRFGPKKWLAMKSHRSQKLPTRVALYRFEWYHEVEPRKKYPHKFVEFKI